LKYVAILKTGIVFTIKSNLSTVLIEHIELMDNNGMPSIRKTNPTLRETIEKQFEAAHTKSNLPTYSYSLNH
jgi:hypothetical protein